MADLVTSFIETVGYPGIVLLMILEIPVPLIQSEIVMTFSGFTSSRGNLHPVGAVVAGITGSQVGSILLFWAATRLGEDRVNDVLARWGGWLGFDRDSLERGQDSFRRHDHWAVLVGRLVPGLRSFIAIPAGIQRMPFWEFFALNLVGTAFWVTVLTWAGSILGDNYRAVDQYSSFVTYGLVAALVVYVAYRIGVAAKHRADAS